MNADERQRWLDETRPQRDEALRQMHEERHLRAEQEARVAMTLKPVEEDWIDRHPGLVFLILAAIVTVGTGSFAWFWGG